MSPALLLGFGILAAAALITALIITPLIMKMAVRTGYVDLPGERKIHESVTPYGGGIAIFFSIVTVVGIGYLVAVMKIPLPGLGSIQDELAVHLGGLRAEGTLYRLAAIFIGGSAMFILGFIDDRRPLSPGFKLAVQIAAAAGLFLAGIKVTLFIDSDVTSLVFTVLWVVGITNAMNLLDNMDGLSAGVGTIAGFVFFVIALQSGQVFVAAMLAVLIGSLLGFLCFNFAPARVFMGDAGSLFLGFILAATSVNTTYYSAGGPGLAVVMPVVVLSIPIFDTLSVIVIRKLNGKPLMTGDKNHFSHRLIRLGMTVREAVLTIYILSLTIGLSATLLVSLSDAGALLILLHTFGIITVIVLLECAAARRRGDD